MHFPTPQQPSESLISLLGNLRPQTLCRTYHYTRGPRTRLWVPTLAERGHFPKEALLISLENNLLCSLHSLQQPLSSPWLRRIFLNSNEVAWWPAVLAGLSPLPRFGPRYCWWKPLNRILGEERCKPQACCISHKENCVAEVGCAGDTDVN